ncbi:hypothetical protein GW915_06885 [bacterium]|nr:hypothetical protein [bacterium]
MPNLRQFYLCLSLLFLGSCATDIDFKIPLNRFETPETQGDFPRGEAEVYFNDAVKITTAEVYENVVFGSSAATVDTEASMIDSGQYGVGFRMGLLSRLDFFLKDFSDSISGMGLKFQLYGSPQSAAERGFKLAVAGSYGLMDQEDGSLKIVKAGEERTYDTNININSFDVNLIPGFRVSEVLLVYMNLFYSEYETISTLTSNQFGDISIKGRVTSYGALTGIQIAKAPVSGSLKVEVGYGHTEWQNQIKLDSFVWGLAGGINW